MGCEGAGFSTRTVVEVDEVAQESLIENRDRCLPALHPDAISDIDG
jgi:hypothetical protein